MPQPRAGAAQGPGGAGVAVAALGQLHRSADVGEVAVAALQQMAHGQSGAPDVVDGDRAALGAGCDAVDGDVGDAVPLEGGQVLTRRAGGGDQEAAHPLLGEEGQVFGLFGGALDAVAEHDTQPGGAGGALRARRDVDEERVGHVEDQQGDDAAASRAQMAGRLAPYVAEAFDGGLHALPGLLGHHRGPVDDVGDRAHGDPGGAGDLLDPDRPAHPGTPVVLGRAPRLRRTGLSPSPPVRPAARRSDAPLSGVPSARSSQKSKSSMFPLSKTVGGPRTTSPSWPAVYSPSFPAVNFSPSFPVICPEERAAA